MTNPETIAKKKQQLACLERTQALQKLKTHKAQIRHKIEMGDLVIKAGMNSYPKTIILGALLCAFEDLQKNISAEARFNVKGKTYIEETVIK